MTFNIQVSNESQFHAAIRRLSEGSVNIHLLYGFTCTLPIPVVKAPESYLYLSGVAMLTGTLPIINFNLDWDNTGQAVNGLGLYCKKAVISHVGFTGFNALGAMIKQHMPGGSISVSNCEISGIGNAAFRKLDKTVTGYDRVFTQIVTGYGLEEYEFCNNTVTDCVTNAGCLSHAVYYTAKRHKVSGNRFIRCGMVFAPFSTDGIGSVDHNYWETAPCQINESGDTCNPYVLYRSRANFFNNTIRGALNVVYTDTENTLGEFINYNNMLGATCQGIYRDLNSVLRDAKYWREVMKRDTRSPLPRVIA